MERYESALLICNGEPPSRRLVQKLASRVDVVVAADGGANVARACGIRPDMIIGDLDSITPATKRLYASSSIIRVKRQDNTDLEKALDYLLSRKIEEVTIVGATGRRIDFTFANLSITWNYTSRMRITFVGDGWEAMPVESGKKIDARVGTTVSLIPFGACSGVTLAGLRYPLNDATMKVGEIGVSNVVKKSPFSVAVRRGKIMMFIMQARW